MKELSIEEKAKAYDMALENAKHYHSEMGDDICCVLEKCFPVLNESEDEKTRKELISFVRRQIECHDKPNVERDEKFESWIAWLEKQGEKKSIISPKFRVGDTIKCKYDNRLFTIKSVDLEKETYTYTQKGCGNDIDYADEYFELVGQKPAEWSEEDKKMFVNIKACLRNANKDYSAELDWLKSLKPQKQWKPSEEQMKALEHFARSVGESGYASPYDRQTKLLYSLLEQLKQL